MVSSPRRMESRRPARPPAASVLGRSHPIARSSAWRSALAGQLVANTGLLTVAAVLSRGSTGWYAVLSISIIAELCLACGLALARTLLRERARDAIADGTDEGDLAEVREIAAEVARLSTPHARVRLSDNLARALREAEHWTKLPIGSRPPPAVRNLLDHDAVAREIVRLACEPDAPVRALALLDRLLRAGYGSMVYSGPSEPLGRELDRVRYLLDPVRAPAAVPLRKAPTHTCRGADT